MCWIRLPESLIFREKHRGEVRNEVQKPGFGGVFRGVEGVSRAKPWKEHLKTLPSFVVALLIHWRSVEVRAVSVSEQNRSDDSGTVGGWSSETRQHEAVSGEREMEGPTLCEGRDDHSSIFCSV